MVVIFTWPILRMIITKWRPYKHKIILIPANNRTINAIYSEVLPYSFVKIIFSTTVNIFFWEKVQVRQLFVSVL